MDDFERALLITFDFSSAVDTALKARASDFINEVKANPSVWRLAIERFSTSNYLEIKFWCLQTLHEVVRSSYGSFKEDEKAEVKAALLMWLQRDCGGSVKAGLPHFLRNKLAQTLVAVLLFEYPGTWPRFFQDLIRAMHAMGEGLVDMFCRILVSVDEDLVSLDIPRSQDESKLSMHVKDSMREFSTADISTAWLEALETYQGTHPDLATQVLQTMQRFVSWIDICLVANDRSMALLLGILASSPSASLRGAASDCLSEIVSKRMEAVPKLTLIQTMGIVPRCASWANGFPLPVEVNGTSKAQEADDDRQMLVVKMARLLATLATEVIDSLKRIENQVISFGVMGLSVDDEAAEEVRAASGMGHVQMQSLFPALLSAFQSGLDDVSLPLMPFMHAYVARLKVQLKRTSAANNQLPPEQSSHIRAILQGIAASARYPSPESACSWMDHEQARAPNANLTSPPSTFITRGGAGGASSSQIAAAKEEQQDVEEKRKDLFVLFRNIAKLAFNETLSFVGSLLQHATSLASNAGGAEGGPSVGSRGSLTSPPSSPSPSPSSSRSQFQHVEVAVSLLHEMGEGAPEEALKPDSGQLGTMAAALMLSSLPSSRHRLVALAVLETYVRYARVLQTHPHAMTPAIAAFLDERGMGHPSDEVSARACYLFCRLVKTLRSSFKGLTPSILQSLQPHLTRIATSPLPEVLLSTNSSPSNMSSGSLMTLGSGDKGGIGVKDGGGAGASKPTNAVAVDDRLYVFEAVGLLLGQDDIPPEQQALFLGSLLQPLKEQIETSLTYASPTAPTSTSTSPLALDPSPSTRLSMQMASGLIIQALEAIVRLSKGFRTDVLIRSRPQLGAMFLACFQAAIGSLNAFPTHRLLRSRFVTSVHRLVEGLGVAMLPHLPLALETLISLVVVSPSATNGPLSATALPSNAVGDLIEVLALTNQLIIKFKDNIGTLLQALLPVLIGRVFMVLGGWDWSGRSSLPTSNSINSLSTVNLDDTREKAELQKSFYSLLHVIVHAGLSSILLKVSSSPLNPNPNPPIASTSQSDTTVAFAIPNQEGGRGGELDSIISSLMTGARHLDPTVRRTCLQILTRLVSDWCGGGGGTLGTMASTTSGGSSGGAGKDDVGMDVSSSSPRSQQTAVGGKAQASTPSDPPMSISSVPLVGAELVPGFRRYAVDTIATEACILALFGPLDPSGQPGAVQASSSPPPVLLDPKDAATNAVLGEVATLLKLIASTCCTGGGGELGSHLLATSLPLVGLPLELQHQVAVCLRDCEARELREALKACLVWLVSRLHQNSSRMS